MVRAKLHVQGKNAKWEYLSTPQDMLLKAEVTVRLLAMKHNTVISKGTHDV